MAKVKFYILAWHDEGNTNRAETIWTGYDPKEAKQRFEEAKFTDDIFFIEAWANNPEYDQETRLMYKYL